MSYLFEKIITWAKDGSRWRWVLAVLALICLVMAFPFVMMLWKPKGVPTLADHDLKDLQAQESIRQDVAQKEVEVKQDLQEQVKVIDTQSKQDSVEKIKQDTLKEVMND
jgi:hypothetical protein